MKATEVLRRYAKGERDFRRADLRGQSFRGQDLSGADFSGANICGTNFSNAILRKTNFTAAKAGLQKRWITFQVGLSFLVSTILTFLCVTVVGISTFGFLTSEGIKYNHIFTSIGILFLFLSILLVVAWQGLSAKAIGLIAIFIGFLISFLVGFNIFIYAKNFPNSIGISIPIVIASAVSGGTIISISATTVIASSIAVISGVSSSTAVTVFGILGAVCGAYIAATGNTYYTVAVNVGDRFVMAISGGINLDSSDTAIPVIFLLVLYSILVWWRTSQGNANFSIIHALGIAFSCIGGTSFCGADLTGANFSHAILKSTNFNHTKQKQTVLTHACWQDAKKLDRARVGDSILSNAAVRDLLISHNGYKKSYVDAKLRGANLNGVNLNEANLKWADLSDATLHRADLRGADLTETLVLGTDFAGACLTGACLEAWNIDHTTNLEGVDCQYIYLLGNQQERRPSSGDFAPGEFTKLFQEVLSTVDLIFRNGVDWKAFVTAFRQVQVENGDTPLEVQSIENKGDGVVIVRVSVPSEANKEKIHAEFNQQYELAREALEAKYRAELQAKESEITVYREQSVNMWGVINSLANRPINVPINVQANSEAKAMNDSTDQSRNINVGGDLNLTGSTLNLGEISGTVTNTINQLPDRTDPNQPSLKELLSELQGAIESEPNLPDPDKVEALEQVGTLAKAGQNLQDGTLKKLANTAVKVLKGTVASLPSAATLAEACTKLLPLIGKALGLPI